MSEIFDGSYDSFQSQNCDANAESDFDKIGMNEVSGKIRYNAINHAFHNMLGIESHVKILDLGSGYGNMWDHMSQLACDSMTEFTTHLNLVDRDLVALESSKKLLDTPSLGHVEINYYHDDGLSYLEELANEVGTTSTEQHPDVIIACGSLDYYSTSQIDSLLKSIRKLGIPAILEANIQSPELVSSPGTYHLSLGTWNDLLYQNFLFDGKSSVTVQLIKKCTAVFAIEPNGTELLISE